MIKKFSPPKEFRDKMNSWFHTALTTENNEALVLFCNQHMYIFELTKEERDEADQADQAEEDSISGYKLGELIIHENMNIKNLRLFGQRHIYSLYNRENTKHKNSRLTNPM